jgi:outer membrane lipoprotein-sorting protein
MFKNKESDMKFMMTLCSTLFISLILGASAYAERSKDELLMLGSSEEVGEAIAVEFDDRDLGFVDQRSVMNMTMKNAYGEESYRKMTTRTLERQDRSMGDKSLIVFESPRDVKGTALLSFAEILEQDEQWLYLPSLKRVKRISSNNKSGPFVGSEFAYEDITGNEIGKYSWKFLAIEECPGKEGVECFKLEARPKYEYSGYTKRIVWVDTEEFRVQKVDFYDRKDALMKTQNFIDYKQYLEKYWRADKWTMNNHQTEKRTDLEFTFYEFKTGLTDADFTQAALKRIK